MSLTIDQIKELEVLEHTKAEIENQIAILVQREKLIESENDTKVSEQKLKQEALYRSIVNQVVTAKMQTAQADEIKELQSWEQIKVQEAVDKTRQSYIEFLGSNDLEELLVNFQIEYKFQELRIVISKDLENKLYSGKFSVVTDESLSELSVFVKADNDFALDLCFENIKESAIAQIISEAFELKTTV